MKRRKVILPPASPAVMRGLRLAVSRLHTNDPLDLGLGQRVGAGLVMTRDEQRRYNDFLEATRWLAGLPAK